MSAASEEDLETATLSSERWGWGFGGLVVLGLIGEIFVAALHPQYGSFWGTWGPVLGDLLVAIGVAGEILLGINAHRCQSELQRRSSQKLADAIERAAKLEKEAADARERTTEIERLTARRHLSPGQSAQISHAMQSQASTVDLLVEFQTSDSEAFAFSQEICAAFKSAGVLRIRTWGNSYLSGSVFGLRIAASEAIDIASLMQTFASSETPFYKMSINLTTHLPGNASPPNLYVFVGPKPAPEAVANRNQKMGE